MSQKQKIVLVETDKDGQVIRIFANRKAGFASGRSMVWVPRAVAVSEIRHQLWLRSGGYCEDCDGPVTEKTGHMHERKHRGQGGEISLANSAFICAECHQFAHRNRNPRWKNPLDKKF